MDSCSKTYGVTNRLLSSVKLFLVMLDTIKLFCHCQEKNYHERKINQIIFVSILAVPRIFRNHSRLSQIDEVKRPG